ncbi:hypothetical protein HX870_10935 [Pseudomonas gingeri]|uniref:Lipoprotein n=1 Tax=Pseudomonas gingeri TaxID=117681 RepID=A0A7Y7X813_9PSED|nr:hypothetical protein [Pseudomonas gingeri]NWA23786.1 hypothetical protein [Pseudomonas gingeri]NWB94686.1 hypothetical protein [Pseudomonas gingeri]NWD68110.1 hypothetical protein [Pseudomonas gingeri]NWD73215.1 hypothetical protein [Pseudomonas gingeri]
MTPLLQSISLALFCAVLSGLISLAAFASGVGTPESVATEPDPSNARRSKIVTSIEISNDTQGPLELLGTGLDLAGAAPSSFNIASGERRELVLDSPRAWFIYGAGPRKCRFVAQHTLQERFAQTQQPNYLPIWIRKAESIGERQASCKARLSKTLKAPPYSYNVKFSMS